MTRYTFLIHHGFFLLKGEAQLKPSGIFIFGRLTMEAIVQLINLQLIESQRLSMVGMFSNWINFPTLYLI